MCAFEVPSSCPHSALAVPTECPQDSTPNAQTETFAFIHPALPTILQLLHAKLTNIFKAEITISVGSNLAHVAQVVFSILFKS